MKSTVSFLASPALLMVALAGPLHAADMAQRAPAPNVKIYTGQDAIRKELEVLDQVMSDAATRVINGETKSDELEPLVSRRASLQQMLGDSRVGESTAQSSTITGCGQSLQLGASSTPGMGNAHAGAASTVQLDFSYPARVEGVLYAIAKNPYTTNSSFKAFSFHSQKQPSGSYFTSVSADANASFASCGKSYATGAISTLDGNPVVCGNVPVIVESQHQAGVPFFDCSIP